MKKILFIINMSLLYPLFAVQPAQAVTDGQTKRTICSVFKKYCSQALRVAWCESHYKPWARNGQYLGIFQMGSSERRIYGHGNTPLAQARAAYRYFAASGYDWSPWSCKPW